LRLIARVESLGKTWTNNTFVSQKPFAAGGGAAGLAAAGAVGEAKELRAAIGPEAEKLAAAGSVRFFCPCDTCELNNHTS
jgi:hypothetical protein